MTNVGDIVIAVFPAKYPYTGMLAEVVYLHDYAGHLEGDHGIYVAGELRETQP